MKHDKEPQLKLERVDGQPKAVVVSTVRTYAGGAHDTGGWPFSAKDFAKETPWPFETMVFEATNDSGTGHGGRGLYHRAYGSLSSARRGHARVVALALAGALPPGTCGGMWGTPILTAKEWRAQQRRRRGQSRRVAA